MEVCLQDLQRRLFPEALERRCGQDISHLIRRLGSVHGPVLDTLLIMLCTAEMHV